MQDFCKLSPENMLFWVFSADERCRNWHLLPSRCIYQELHRILQTKISLKCWWIMLWVWYKVNHFFCSQKLCLLLKLFSCLFVLKSTSTTCRECGLNWIVCLSKENIFWQNNFFFLPSVPKFWEHVTGHKQFILFGLETKKYILLTYPAG